MYVADRPQFSACKPKRVRSRTARDKPRPSLNAGKWIAINATRSQQCDDVVGFGITFEPDSNLTRRPKITSKRG